jgi:oligoribonuclease (3'-5' exoribonuclease)
MASRILYCRKFNFRFRNQKFRGIINTPRLESYLHKSISKVNTISEIRVRKVPVQGSRVELRQHKNLVYSTIDAVAHRDVYKPIAPSNWYLQNTMN